MAQPYKNVILRSRINIPTIFGLRNSVIQKKKKRKCVTSIGEHMVPINTPLPVVPEVMKRSGPVGQRISVQMYVVLYTRRFAQEGKVHQIMRSGHKVDIVDIVFFMIVVL